MELLNSDAICLIRHDRAPPADGIYRKKATHTANKDENMEGMPIGHADFKELRDRDLYFVDKSPLIDMILRKSSKVMLFTRPRRFGKTLSMSMLDAYLSLRYAGERDRFSDLKISEIRPDDPEKNSNVVVKVSLKDLGNGTYDHFLLRMEKTAFDLYQSFFELQSSDRLDPGLLEIYNKVYERRSMPKDLESCLADLCKMLEKHYGKKPILLIDEYDSVMNMSYGRPKDHELIMAFMRMFLSTALKDNESIRFAVLTGVMRISKESIFSGLNNPDVYDVFSKEYDEMFGFTQAEVEKLLSDNGHPEKLAEAQEWYDGYRFGDADVYNPWSILKYVDRGFVADSYWAGTSGNSIIRDQLHRCDADAWKGLKALCSGSTISKGIRKELVYSDLDESRDALYSVMVATGYLKAVPNGSDYDLTIPNKEMFGAFAETILTEFGLGANPTVLSFVDAVESGDVGRMTSTLENLMDSLSNRILYDERSYQTFIVGLMANAHKRFEITADHEAGKGYYDIRMKRLYGSGPNAIIEIKRRTKRNVFTSMDKLARMALDQIHEKKYYRGLEGETILYGIAFDQKEPTIVMEKL